MKKKLLIILAISVLSGMAGKAFAQQKRTAVVEFSANYMRINPDYESALETQELMGTVVEIVGESGYWREIASPQPYKAWTTSLGLVEMDGQELAGYLKAPKLIYTSRVGCLYSGPSSDSKIICDLVGGDILRASVKQKFGNTGQEYKWKHLVTKGKWVKAILPSGKSGYVPKNEVALHNEWKEKTVPTTESFIATAETMLGVPYLWGGMTFKGVDCSGLVRVSAILNNFYLPRNASQQINCGQEVQMDVDSAFWDEENRIGENSYTYEYIAEMKTRVKNLERGDLVFFGYPAEGGKPARVTHVGIYLGNNHIIHSSHTVRKNSLIPGEADFYENSHKLIAARRLNLLDEN